MFSEHPQEYTFIPFGKFVSGSFTATSSRAIRHAVFVEEQGVDETLEQDGKDTECAHLLRFRGSFAVATMRIRKTEEGLKFERIAVLREHRGEGLGKALIQEALSRFTGERIYIHAQEHAEGFYASLGFVATGEKTIEAGIPHVTMRLPIS